MINKLLKRYHNKNVVDAMEYKDPHNRHKTVFYVNHRGQLRMQSLQVDGIVFGVLEYTEINKTILHLPKDNTCIDFYILPLRKL